MASLRFGEVNLMPSKMLEATLKRWVSLDPQSMVMETMAFESPQHFAKSSLLVPEVESSTTYASQIRMSVQTSSYIRKSLRSIFSKVLSIALTAPLVVTGSFTTAPIDFNGAALG